MNFRAWWRKLKRHSGLFVKEVKWDLQIWRNWIKKVIQGVIWGAAGMVPGMSAGIIAMSFGFYDQVVAILAAPLHNFSRNVRFFLPLLIGAGLGFALIIFLLSQVLQSDTAKTYMVFLFIGFLLGSLPSMFRTANQKGYQRKYWWAFGISAAVFLAFAWWQAMAGNGGDSSNNQLAFGPVNEIIAGVLNGLGTIIPGWDSNTLLAAMGIYDDYLSAFINLDWRAIVLVSAGFLVSLILFAKVLKWLLDKFYGMTYYVFIGLTVSSVFLIWPSWPSSFWGGALAVFLLILGTAGAYLLNNFGNERLKIS